MIKTQHTHCTLFFACLSFLLLLSCGGTQNTTKKGKDAFLTGKTIYEDETFVGIKNNTARLCAMLSGKYVQYNKNNSERVYKAWMVNGGKDSVMVYALPVGDPNKVGYWMYYYQIMTSLPDEPIYEAFGKMESIDRDTIRVTYYEAPDDFNVPLKDLTTNPNAAFAQVKLESLSLSKYGEIVTYVRKTPLHFEGRSPLMPDPQSKGRYRVDCYNIRPEGHTYQILRYTSDKEPIDGQNAIDKLVKTAMMRSHTSKKK